MRIGLIRHFKVDLKKSQFMTSKQFNEYMEKYNVSDVIPNEVVIDDEWDKCYCSSISRAIITAKTIYHGETIITDKLVEISSAAFMNIKIPISYYLWAILGRFAWNRNHRSQPEGRKTTLKRINEILDTILDDENENILIVSHAGTLYEIRKILSKRGFKGEKFLKARNGKIYIFEKK
ncbi:histidine phosphatase family protein [Clostridium sp. CF012]|uniref:histidine phosphatase family protein n=1 Tax=Clostridium sp. CF012 TaxID=2843319 RepID=UPI001C0C75E9|nr:histidine phosphatase family protein [Clostridium sp. CF012]MBU3144037.1 histidine phosphatase family protein [Clostridium sp. CF012]